MPTRSSVASGRVLVDTLLSGSEWSGTVSWSIASTADARYLAASTVAPPRALESAVAAALGEVAAFTRLDVERGGRDADVRVFAADWVSFVDAGRPTTVSLGGYAFFPGAGPLAGDVWLGRGIVADLTPGTYGYRVLLHEIGHALGLKQPDEAGGFGRLPAARDGAEWSVMSARGVAGDPVGALGLDPEGYAQTYMVRDIAALQHLYGANYADRGDDVYRFDPGERVMARTIWDGGGRDTYDFGRYTTAVSISLEPGGWCTTGQEAQLNRAEELATGAAPVYAGGSIYNAELFEGRWRSGIENAVGGSGDDTIVGNRLHNELWGGGGDDTMFGGAGRDRIDGGGGDDRIDAGSWSDTLLGGVGADTMIGRSGDDLLVGGRGDDLLSGSNDDDRLYGGLGDDVLHGGNGDDALFGGQGDDRLIGWTGTDRLEGGAGADVFDLRGRTGSDVVADFTPGEDHLLVDDPAAVYASAVADGADTVLRLDAWGDVVRLLGIAPAELSLDDLLGFG